MKFTVKLIVPQNISLFRPDFVDNYGDSKVSMFLRSKLDIVVKINIQSVADCKSKSIKSKQKNILSMIACEGLCCWGRLTVLTFSYSLLPFFS